MERPVIDSQSRDWYSVSVDTLRIWGVLLAVAALALLGFFGYRYWESHDLERRASAVIGEARSLMNRLQGEEVVEQFRPEYQSAIDSLQDASAAYSAGDFGTALEQGRRGRALFQSIIDSAGGQRGGAAAAQFISVQGRVEYRRGDRNTWQDARARVALQAGDHVRTASDGSAEILFLDGSLYTARPDTQLIISRTRGAGDLPIEQSIRMDYGWVNLNTSSEGGKVATPDAEARVAGASEATVTYDAGSRTGRFATYRGSMEVASKDGELRRVGALEQVVQREAELTEPEALPSAPTLLDPEDNAAFDLDRTEEVVLRWNPVQGASGYALQVSRGHLFVDNVIDVEGRESTRATVGVRGAGSFLWRVAAASDGMQGPWSPARSLRVAAVRSGQQAGDDQPPPLELGEIKSYGSIFIVGGRTEPGALIEVNGEPVQVAADGTFTKTIQVTEEGWSFIEVRARDAAGNETVANSRVFVEIL